MAANPARLFAGGLVLVLLAPPPLAKAEMALRARSEPRASAVERALTGGLVTLRTPGSLMIRIAAGNFVMGSTADEALAAAASCAREPLGNRCNERTFTDELPRHSLRLGSFWLDRTEVTAGDYDRCAARGRCPPRPLEGGARRFATPKWPATFVTAREAETYCRARGARLPREAEFERAARGTSGRTYPWGDFYNGKLANHGRGGLDASDASDGYAELAPVGSFPNGATPDGFLDLAGNAAEWTADAYSERYDLPPDPNANALVLRGGHYASDAAWLRGAARRPLGPDERRPFVGFRCARSFSAETDEPEDAKSAPGPAAGAASGGTPGPAAGATPGAAANRTPGAAP
jgi:formylglycine-generating enzyme required for sulfatase activity